MKLTYRPEIDGLRAIAVGVVILYHAQITFFDNQPFQGGFIGVDIFFVISGYLITSIILKELVATGSFSFKYFYERRIRRILPALFFVMLVSFPFAIMFLIPSYFLDYSKSIIYSLWFSSNFYFWYSGQEYGAASALLKPFLHTWSLSIEEQYYVIFPIFLLFFFKYFRKYIIFTLILFFIISFVLANWVGLNYSSLNFYILPTRGWELLAGSILSYLEIIKGYRSKKGLLNSILPSFGLILICHSIFFFNDQLFHPSIYTLSPVVGVCLIIWFSNKNEIVTKLLSTKLFVGFGLISYSLYLWHYPIFALSRITSFTNSSILNKFYLGITVLFLSIFSYYFIEKPFRNKKFKFKKLLNLIFFIFFLIFCINLYVIYKNGRAGFFYHSTKNIYLNNDIFNDQLREKSWKFVENFNSQEFKSKNKIKILLVGDSHSKDLFNVFIQNSDLFKDYEFLRYGDNENKNSLNFDNKMNKKDLKKFEKSNIFNQSDIVLISNYFSEEDSFEKLDNFLKLFKDKKRIILSSNSNIYINPKSKYNLNLTLFDDYLLDKYENSMFIDKNLDDDIKLDINKFYYRNLNIEDVNEINDKLSNIAKKHNVDILYKKDFQCNIIEEICFGVTEDGMKIHYDYGHFTLEGASFFGKKIYETNWLKID